MNLILSLCVLLSMGVNPFSNTNATADVSDYSTGIEAASIQWESTSNDLGQIEQNVPVTTVFEFKNKTKKPLIISDAKGSCGCTNVAFDKHTLAPGERSEITATYNAKKVGAFNKTVRVYTSFSEEAVVLNFKGEVLAAEESAVGSGK